MRISMMSALIAAVWLAACGNGEDPTAGAATGLPKNSAGTVSASGRAETPAQAAQDAASGSSGANAVASTSSRSLEERLDCLRANGVAMVIAHRGGPTRDHPENAIETLDRTLRAGSRGMEIDIAKSRDGVLFLMHDEDLDRTTTGEGLIEDKDWSEIRALKLETYSTGTKFNPPLLADALAWAVENDALVELDNKRTATFAEVVEAVKAAKAQDHVMVITYSREQAIEVHRLAPELVITSTIDTVGDLEPLIAAGVNPKRLVAWTGTERPDPALWGELDRRGVESAFGTLGRRGERLDDVYWEDRDGSEFEELSQNGATFIVTDFSDRVSRQLGEAARAAQAACGWKELPPPASRDR